MNSRIICLLLCVFLAAVCGCAVVVGDQVVGVESGKFVSTDGAMRTDYKYPIDKVWDASIKALFDLKATQIVKDKRIGKGEIEAMLNDEKVKVTVLYAEKELTSVAVRVGLTGNNIASKMILDKIKENLAKP